MYNFFSYKTPSIWFELYLQSVRIMTEFKNYFYSISIWILKKDIQSMDCRQNFPQYFTEQRQWSTEIFYKGAILNWDDRLIRES